MSAQFRGTAPVASGGGGDLVAAIRSHAFSKQEQLVADFVNEKLEATIEMTIAELAEACGVSKPTVIRFCRSVGCDGFRDFKLRLAQNIAVNQMHRQHPAELPSATGEASVQQVLGALLAGAAAARDQIDPKRFEAVRDLLATSRQILFVGVGGDSSLVAIESANRFFRLGIPSFSQSDGLLLRMWASALSAGDTLFAISASGETEAVIDAAAIAREYGAQTVCITRPGSRLAASAEHPIVVELPDEASNHGGTARRYAQLIIIDALALAVQNIQSETTTDYLRRVRASLTGLGRTIGFQTPRDES